MAVIEISKIQVRRGQENQTGIPTLAGGEFGWAADTEHLYIGLSREDGGSRDANVRILTENDILGSNLFNSNLVSDHTYRSDTYPPITANPSTLLAFSRSIHTKVDDFVSIKDFGVIGEGGAANESELIQTAIDRLFLDPLKINKNYGTYTAKVLYFPAGIYNIDQPMLLPAYTTIVGEGIGKTIINLTSTSSHAIQTIDADINDLYTQRVTFETGNITSGIGQPNYIRIENMTIRYAPDIQSVEGCLSLLSLDCSENAIIRDVRFQGIHTNGDRIDIGHSGIDIRGYAGSEDLTVSSNNTLIDNCEFDRLYYCIVSNYDIVNPIIQNSQLYNSVRGITFNDEKDPTADIGPRGARILNNRFSNIEQQAIFVGEGSFLYGSNHISMNNRFYDVGNLGWNREANTGTAVISYFSDGNITVNDWFDRQEYQNQNLTTILKYNPIVEGHAVISNPGVSKILLSELETPLFRLPITGLSQSLIMDYNLTLGEPGNYSLDRIGTIKVYIQPGDSPDDTNIVDEYNFNNGDLIFTWKLNVNPLKTYYELVIGAPAIDTITLEYSTRLMS